MSRITVQIDDATEMAGRRASPVVSSCDANATPTVDGDRVYTLTRQGLLACLNVKDGAVIWQKDFKKEFGGHMMSGWDYSESPTIDGDKLICTPGGKNAAMLALNKLSGDVYWKCEAPVDSGAGYAAEAVQLQANRYTALPDGTHRLAATNPVHLVTGVLR